METLKGQYDALVAATTYEAYGIEDGFLDRMMDLDYVLTPGEEAYLAVHHELEQMEKMLWPDEA